MPGFPFMIPISLDPLQLPMAVAGRGPTALRRFRLLRAGGAAPALFHCPPHDTDNWAPKYLNKGALPRIPDDLDLAGLRVLWIAGLPHENSVELARRAQALRLLVNVEDTPDLCDFHNVAEVRRGDLLLTVSTHGRSPGLAARIRAHLEEQFGPEWAERLDAISSQRSAWRREGRSMTEVSALTHELVSRSNWLTQTTMPPSAAAAAPAHH